MKKIIISFFASLLFTIGSAGLASASAVTWYQPELPEE
ncbi:MAG: cyclic lactone autoinducer peptide [Halanaerobiaceae bacterium]